MSYGIVKKKSRTDLVLLVRIAVEIAGARFHGVI